MSEIHVELPGLNVSSLFYSWYIKKVRDLETEPTLPQCFPTLSGPEGRMSDMGVSL